jgi:hypothetical protein
VDYNGARDDGVMNVELEVTRQGTLEAEEDVAMKLRRSREIGEHEDR